MYNKFRKLTFLTLFLITIYIFIPINAYAEEQSFEDILSQLILALDGNELNESLNESWKELDFDGDTLEEKLMSVINGDFAVNFNNVFSAIINLIFSGVKKLFPTLISVCAIALLYSFVRTLNPQFLSDGMGRILYFACYAAIISLLIYKTFNVANKCFESIEKYSSQMDIVFPLIITVMSATGATVSASVYSPAVAFLSAGISNIISMVIIPLIIFLIIFSAISGLSQTIKTEKMISFLCSIIKWILGICVTVFTMFMSVQGLTAGIYDGITLRITKYTIGNSIPIVGGFLKDGVDMFLAAGILIKNALGVCGIILVLFAFVSPLVELIVFTLFLKLASGIIEPFTDNKMSDYMVTLAKNLNYVLASILVVSFMYIITIVLIICTGGAFI